MSLTNYGDNGFVHNLNLLIILHQLCISNPTRSGKSAHKRPTHLHGGRAPPFPIHSLFCKWTANSSSSWVSAPMIWFLTLMLLASAMAKACHESSNKIK